MLETRRFLKRHSMNFDLLTKQLGIKVNINKQDDRVILNYSQIDSPKTHPVVMECRGLTLDFETGELIARSFPRFFNAGEVPVEFNWNDCTATHKEDGSLLLVFMHQGQWKFQTRNSFAAGIVTNFWNESQNITWEDLAKKALLKTDFFYYAIQDFTYVFELCSPFNKIVRSYDTEQVYLLSVFYDEKECSEHRIDCIAQDLRIKRPHKVKCNSLNDALDFVNRVSEEDRTFEGVVMRDYRGVRLKIKSKKYLELSRRLNNGNIFLDKYLIPAILDGEKDEILTYFPELKGRICELETKLSNSWKEASNFWYCYHDEPNQKKFALAVANCKYKAALFKARKGIPLRECWKELILKGV